MESFLTVFSYFWRITWNIIVILVTLYVFSRLRDRVEVIVVALLGMLYGTIRAIAFMQGVAQGQFIQTMVRDVYAIKARLQLPGRRP